MGVGKKKEKSAGKGRQRVCKFQTCVRFSGLNFAAVLIGFHFYGGFSLGTGFLYSKYWPTKHCVSEDLLLI